MSNIAYSRVDHVVSCNVADEVVLLDTQAGMYFGLNRVGATIWNRLHVPSTLPELVSAVTELYDVAPERAEMELGALLRELCERRLIDAA